MEYRLYYLDAGDHVISAEYLEVADDAAALAEAQGRCLLHQNCVAVELWQATRRVGYYQRGSPP